MAPSITLTHGRRNVALFLFVIAQILAGLLGVICVILDGHLRGSSIYPYSELLLFFALGIAVGIPFSQVTLLATWNALGNGRLGLRPIGSIVCLIVVWWVGFGLPYVASQFPINIAAAGIAMFVQWILVQVPLWIVRLTFGWQMGVIDQQNEASGPSDLQFGIKHLIIWTTFVAIVLGLAKLLVGKVSVDSQEAVGFGLLLICNSLLAWPTLLGSLAYRWMPAALLAAFAFAIAITIAEPFVFKAILGEANPMSIFWGVNGAQFFWIAGSMLILRRFGFRLVRPRRVHE